VNFQPVHVDMTATNRGGAGNCKYSIHFAAPFFFKGRNLSATYRILLTRFTLAIVHVIALRTEGNSVLELGEAVGLLNYCSCFPMDYVPSTKQYLYE